MARGLPRKISKRNELHSRRSQEFYNWVADREPTAKKGKKKGRGNRSQETLNGANQDGDDEENKGSGGAQDVSAKAGDEGASVDTMQILSAIDSIIGSSTASTMAANEKNRTPSPRTRLPPIQHEKKNDHLSASASTTLSGKTRKSTRSRSPSPNNQAASNLEDAGVCHLDMNGNDPLFFSAPNPRISPRSTHQAWVQIAPNASTSPSTSGLDKSLPGTWVSSTEGLNSNSYASKPTVPVPGVDIQVIPVTDILLDDSTSASGDDISSMVNEPPRSPRSMLSSRATSPAIITSEAQRTVTEAVTSPKLAPASVTSSSSVSPTTEFNEGPLSPPPTPAVVQDVFKGTPEKTVDESGQVRSPIDGPGTPPPTPLTTVGPQRVESPSPKVNTVKEIKAPLSPVSHGPRTPPPTPFTAAPAAVNPLKPVDADTVQVQPATLSHLVATHQLPSGSLGLATTPESMEQLGITFAQAPQAPIPTPLHSHDFAYKSTSSRSPATSAHATPTTTAAQRQTSRSPSPSSTALILHPGTSPKSRPLSPSPSPSPPPASRSRQTSVTLGLSGTMLRHTLLLPLSSTSPATSPVLKVRSGPSM
ncbi:hypothetical protein BCR44DRAFT_1514329 [Catenaria anguillulae PL171]|uniref:Uncharacterized protein n=1 Tax=Catenaria anguillulae PL171 TaxID=765915 RepID=A0A1Y2HIQ6_9FUNG|nr:hypothetical protein BCR44DRAFT_1514329 [Catenaria anguillulae PL171]